MREIKFRLWDEIRQKMAYGPTDDNPNTPWVLSAAELCKLSPMQYTGLKDKNGKEIYEGDICLIFGDENRVAVIKYGEFRDHVIELIDCENIYYAMKNGHEVYSVGFYAERKVGESEIVQYALDNDTDTWLEIKGNIHDNPELI